jgi:hypothetical protein
MKLIWLKNNLFLGFGAKKGKYFLALAIGLLAKKNP